MGYENKTGSISSAAPADAHNDADTLANGSNGPATGNVITGAGTTTGKAGADAPQSGHVVAVRGAGGTDASDNGQSLHVDGRFGTLVIDEHGNYKYVADGHAPQNFRDLFQYTLADSKGGRSVADLVISRGGEFQVSENAQKVIPGPDGVVTLPAGVDLNDVHVVGRDLIVTMPDGSQIVIVDGAVFVPQLVLGGVEVPSTNLAALLIDAEPRPAAGTPQSSGGNFDVPVPPLDPGVPLGDLIPPTELSFTPPTFHEVNGIINREPTITIEPDGQPASVAAVDSVNEKGLPTRNGGEPAGSGEIADGNGGNNSDTSETHGGTIIIDSPDGVDGVTINGVLVTGVIGQTIAGAFGTLTITGFNGDNILYSYTLNDNTSGDNTHDDFSVTVTDDDGDQATATLVVNIIDDVPTARPDTDSIPAGQFGPATGNVITDASAGDNGDGDNGADTVGADNAHISLVTGFNGSSDNSGPFVVNGQYGVLTMQADGSYSYTRNPGTPGGVNDVFNYTLTDGDGDTSSTTLTISIGDATPQTGENPLIRFDDDALPGGNPGGVGDDSPDTVNATGQLAGSGGDGPISFSVQTSGAPAGFSYVSGGAGIVLIQQNGHTVLTVTVNANGTYSVVQNAPIDHPAGSNENNQVFTINYTVTDQDNDSAPGTFTINVDDDTPTVGIADRGTPSLTVDETDLGTNATASFASNFEHSFGADGPAAANSLVYTLGISAPGADSGLIDVATGEHVLLSVTAGGVVEGRTAIGGVLVFTVSAAQNGDVTLDQLRAVTHPDTNNPDDSVTLSAGNLVTLTLTATDHDADSASQTLNIGQSLHFEDDGPSISTTGTEPTLTVDETVLATNASASVAGAFTSAFGADGAGTVTYALGTAGGNSGLVDTLTGQNIVLVNNAGVIEGHVGNAAGLLAFTVSIDGSGNVTLDQIRSVVHPNTSNPDDSVTLSADNLVTITATVTDRDGDHQSAVLNFGQNLVFEDDGPSITLSGTEPSLTVDETVLAVNAGPTSFASAFTPVFGSDGPLDADHNGVADAGAVTYTLGINAGSTGLVDTLTHEAVVLSNNGGVIEGRTATTNQLVFTVTVSATGQVTLDQLRAVVHPNTANPDDSVTLAADNLITLTATAHDGDGDTASATLNIGQNLNFEDDGPSANNDTDVTSNVTDTADGNVITGVGTTEGAANHDNPGADGFGSITNLVGFNGSTDGSSAGGGFDVNGQFGTLHMNVDGSYTYTRTSGAGGATDTFTYTYVDGDGDPATATLTITLADNTPVAGTVNVGLDDDALANGNPGGIGDDPDSVNASGNLPGSGGDAPLTFGVLLTGAPAGFTYVSGGAGIVLVQQGGVTVLTVTVNSTTGAYSVVQNAPIDHVAGSDENNQNFTITYTVTDQDTDVANGTINISVDDDTPTVSANAGVQLDDDALAGGNPGGIGDDANATNTSGTLAHSYGADGAGSVAYLTTGAPAGFSYALQGNGDLWVMQGATHVLTLTVNSSTGAYTVSQVAPIVHAAGSDENNQSFTISYRVTDGDGDTVDGSISVNVDDDTPTVSANAAVQLDDDALAGGNPGGIGDDANATNTSGTLAHSYGADGAGSVAYLTTGAPAGFSYALQGNGDLWVMQGATHVLTLTVNSSTGAYTVSQVAPIVHSAGGDENNQSFTISYRVTDGDGDTVDGSISVNVDDDTPTVSANAAVQLDDDALAGGNAGGTGDVNPDTANLTGTLAHSYGADGAGSVALLGTGAPGGFTYDTSTPGTLLIKQGATTVITVTVNPSTGAYTVVQNAPIAHAAGGDENDQAFTINYRVSDSDGDTVDGSIVINVDDDTPTVSANGTQPSLTVDETILATNASADFSGIFSHSFGADGAAAANSIVYTLGVSSSGVDSGLIDTATGQHVLLTVNGSGVVEGRTAVGGDLVFTVSVNGSGSVTLDQIRAVVHPNTSNPDDSVSLTADNMITLTQTVTDKDGDSASATANIGQNLNFEDDGPTLGVVQNQQTDNNPATTPAIGTLHFTPGADGAGSTMTITADVTGLKSGGFNLVTVQSGNVLTAYQDTNGDGIHQAGEATAVFTLTVNPNAGTSGQYVFDLINPLDPTITDTPIGGSSSFGAGPTGFQVLDDTGGAHLSVLTGYNTTASFNEATWLSTGSLTSAMITDAGINGSTTGWGVDNNVFSGTNEFMFFDFGAQPLADPDGPGGIDTSTSGATLPNISTATFDFIQYTTADDITYVVHYTDGTFDSGHVPSANMDASGPDWTFTADAGKFIADIQLYTSGTGPGKVDLVSVGVQTSTLDKTIPFTVQLTDGDGDPTSTGAFSVHVATGLSPNAPAAQEIITKEAATQEGLNTTSLATTSDTHHGSQQTATNSNNVLMGAFAAAGLLASDSLAAAPLHGDLHASVSPLATAAYHAQNLAPIALDSVSGIHGDSMPALASTKGMITSDAASLHSAPEQVTAHALVGGGEVQHAAFASLLQGTEVSAHGGGSMPTMAPVLAMPSAQQLVSLNNGGASSAQHNQAIGQVLSDALHGGTSAPALETALNSLPHGADALSVLASQHGISIPDAVAFGGFMAAHTAFSMETAMVHVDAAPLHA